MEIALLILYIGAAGLAVAAGDRIGALFCLVLRRKCGGGPLLHLPAWIRIGVGLTIPVLGISGVVLGAVGIYGSRAFWMLTHNMEIIALLAFFLVGMLTSIFVGGFCARR